MNRSEIISRKTMYDNLWNNFKDNYLENHLEFTYVDTDDEDVKKDFRTRTNTDFYKFTTKKLSEFLKECEAMKEIWAKPVYPFNKRWIVHDEKMKNTLKRYPKLLDVINFIDGKAEHIETIDIENWTTFTVETGLGTEIRKYSHVIVDKDFYARAEKAIGIKKITIQKHIQAFAKMGILKMIGHLRSYNRAMLYIDGYYRLVGEIGKLKKERFMNQKEHQQALRNFKY